jgi:hopanoid biosynthesis associated protein HpnK
MAARLIINADDFGLTPGINRAIAEAHTAGALTSATLMASGPAFDDAVTIARTLPTLGVGCHIVLTDGTPISPPETIPTLLGDDGKTFRTSLPSFLLSVLRGRISEDDIYREAVAQIQKLQASGIAVTHVDTHKHTHILPGVARPILRAAHTAGVPCIRNPFEQPWSLALGSNSFLREVQVRIIRHLQPRFLALPQIRDRTIRTTDGTIGISATGNLNATTLDAMLSAIPSGTFELVCHPGYNDTDLDAITTRLRNTRDIERLALLQTFANSPNPSLPQLINYTAITP